MLLEKEKLLATCSFSFSDNVFHRYISSMPQNAALYDNWLNSPNDKFLDWSKLKASADGKINVTEKL